MHIAAYYGETQIARYLIDHGANVESLNCKFETPLHHAAAADQAPMTDLLLDSGANLHSVDNYHRTACMVASEEGHLGPLQALISRGADLDIRDIYDDTIWHNLAYSNSSSAFQFLITTARQKDFGNEDAFSESVFKVILRKGSKPQISSMLNFAPDSCVYKSQKINVLISLIHNSNASTSILKILLRRLPQSFIPSLINHRDQKFGTPLYAACTIATPSLQMDAIDILLDAGAEINHDGGKFGTPLMGACAAGRLAAVKLLVSRGAKISYEKEGQVVSALHMARRFPEVIRWLLVGRYMEGPKLLHWSS